MDDIVLGLFIILGGFIGWILGIVGFFKANRALLELRQLRARLEGVDGVPQAAAFASPPAPPWWEPAPQAVPEADAAESKPEVVEAFAEPFAAAEIPAEPPPVVAEKPAPSPAAKPAAIKDWDIEALLTLRWGVWLGAAALLLAGVFLVRYAADEGLLGPGTRCVLAGLLGVALLFGAEWMKRRPSPASSAGWAIDQAPPALAAGGVAVLFGAAYAAGSMFGLVPPIVAFVLMAAASLIGLGVSLRHGQLVAAVGIAGAFLTPALVQSDAPSLPGLFGYLLFVTAAALGVVRYTAWIWLGWATTIAGTLWVFMMTNTATASERWPDELFIPAAALLNLALLPPAALDHKVGRRLAWIPFAALGVIGFLCCTVDQTWVARLAVLLLSPLAVWKAAAEPRVDRLPWVSGVLYLLTLAAWALPPWNPTGEAITTTEGFVQAVLPGAWAPEAIVPFLQTAGLMAAFYAIAGLWFERRAPRPVRWSALTAAVPLLTLIVTFLQVGRFQSLAVWATATLALAIALTAFAAAAMRDSAPEGKRRAGAHAAGAVAALALGCSMLLDDQWLTLAVALFLPPLAWIEARADLVALRRVALVVASFVLVRLLLNWHLPSYDFGTTPVLNGLLLTYGVPAAAFALSARMFRRRADDLAVAVLEAGAVTFLTGLVMLEIRHWASGGLLAGSDHTEPDTDFFTAALRGASFLEAGLDVTALALLAIAASWLQWRNSRPVFAWSWRILGGIALAWAIAMVAANPGFTGVPVGGTPVFDALLPAYALPALLAIVAIIRPPVDAPPWLQRMLGSYAVVTIFVWVTLEVRHFFYPAGTNLDSAPVTDAELWAWSGAWLTLGVILMVSGIRTGVKALRLSAIAIIALTAGKVFMWDMADLVGLWRVLSFLGLGLTLIGLGAVYRRFVQPPPPPKEA